VARADDGDIVVPGVEIHDRASFICIHGVAPHVGLFPMVDMLYFRAFAAGLIRQ
jgi:hypothetical protein